MFSIAVCLSGVLLDIEQCSPLKLRMPTTYFFIFSQKALSYLLSFVPIIQKTKITFFDVLFGEAGRLQNNNVKIQHLH